MQKILLLYFFSGCVSTSAGIKSSEKIFDSSRAALFWTFVYQVLLGAGCFEVQCDVRWEIKSAMAMQFEMPFALVKLEIRKLEN